MEEMITLILGDWVEGKKSGFGKMFWKDGDR